MVYHKQFVVNHSHCDMGRRGRESTKMTIIITHSAFHRVRIDSFILLWVHHRIIITIALVTGRESMRGGQWDVELTSCMTWMFIQQTANTRLTSDIRNRRITSCSDASLHILLVMGEECAISWDLVLVSLYCFFLPVVPLETSLSLSIMFLIDVLLLV